MEQRRERILYQPMRFTVSLHTMITNRDAF